MTPTPTATPAVPGLGRTMPAAPLGRTPEPGRRAAEAPGARRPGENESKTLIVGHGICLTGEITACDKLVVEGRVEATLTSRVIEISDTGLFKGSAEIDEAEVRGRFEGDLIVRKRLFIGATGRVSGKVRYGQLEVEAGGQLSGEVRSTSEDDDAMPRGRGLAGDPSDMRFESSAGR
ncbi:MAG: polymer-forming cytoskeletal protein [Alphaproteobacteria bacterium]|nr:polymer-forming cytoskeletal protein [Alphaproteobacteria bacterium]